MKRKKWLIGAIAYVGLFLICILVIYIFPSLRGVLTSTYIAKQDELSVTDEITGYILRDETVYVAKEPYMVKRLAKEGTLYKAGTPAVELTASTPEEERENRQYISITSMLGKKAVMTSDGASEDAGFVSYKVDGYEARLCPENIGEIKKSEYEDVRTSQLTDTVKGQCMKGEPLYKVTKNGKWYLVFFVDLDETDKYSVGSTVEVTIGDKTDKAYISEITRGENISRIVLKCGFLYDGWITDRKVNASITIASAKGLILETKSIVERDGKKGVIVKDKLGNYIFKRVLIKADDGKNCVACQDLFMDESGNFVETIGIYDEIVARPSEKEIKEAA